MYARKKLLINYYTKPGTTETCRMRGTRKTIINIFRHDNVLCANIDDGAERY